MACKRIVTNTVRRSNAILKDSAQQCKIGHNTFALNSLSINISALIPSDFHTVIQEHSAVDVDYRAKSWPILFSHCPIQVYGTHDVSFPIIFFCLRYILSRFSFLRKFNRWEYTRSTNKNNITICGTVVVVDARWNSSQPLTEIKK